MQTAADPRRVIAANNVLNALFMGGAGFAIAWLTLGGTVPSILLALAIVNIGVALRAVRCLSSAAYRPESLATFT